MGFVLSCLTIDFFHRQYGKALVSVPINRVLQTGMLFKQMCGFNREDKLYKNHLSADRTLVTHHFRFTVLVVPKVTQSSLICRIQLKKLVFLLGAAAASLIVEHSEQHPQVQQGHRYEPHQNCGKEKR